MSDLPAWSAELFIKDLRALEADNKIDSAIDLTLNVMNYFMLNGRRYGVGSKECDYVVKEINHLLEIINPLEHNRSVIHSLALEAWNGQRIGIAFEPFLAKLDAIQRHFDEPGYENLDHFKGFRTPPTGCTIGDVARAYGGNPHLF